MNQSKLLATFLEIVNLKPELLANSPKLSLFYPDWSHDLVNSKKLIILLEKMPISGTQISVDFETSISLFYGSMHILLSDVVNIGYVFELPYSKIINNMIIESRPSNIKIATIDDECEPIVKNTNISIYVLGNAVQILVVKNAAMQELFVGRRVKKDE